MNILEIHEITPEMLSHDLSHIDIFTFDDGLYSQYLYYKEFLKYNKPLIFFISTNIVCQENYEQNTKTIKSSIAHSKAFSGDYSYFMKWSQIKKLSTEKNCYIGGHSHLHEMPDMKCKFSEQLKKDKKDIKNMLSEFDKHNIQIKYFIFPYNIEILSYSLLLKKIGIVVLKDRINIDLYR